MKLLKSKCEKGWFFDVKIEDGYLAVGLACFMGGCGDFAEVEIKGQSFAIEVPHRCIQLPVPSRILNARLALLPSHSDE